MSTIYEEQHHIDSLGYEYLTVINDDNKVRIYTLKNGLKVFLAQNFDAPKIQTYIPVRTGSNRDPKDNTGLAHYLEHMMFKGTSRLGTQNWEEEKKLLDQISDLFEQHKAETNVDKEKEIYKIIDEVSQKASEFAIANEYDKAISSLGATGTNAHTWLDETVYKNNIPKNELKKWLKIENDRFSNLVLRLFHTELESVYEEFNRAQDNDGRLTNYTLMNLLFPTHPNGQQTTLGNPEHLKNPSMVAIHDYFNAYYVPNNFALVLVGDLDFEETIQLIDQSFGQLSYRALPEKENVVEKPITEIVSKTVKSPTIARAQMAWRTDSYGSREAMLADIVANILTNKGEAGLLDLHINQDQKALYAQAFSVGFKQYGYVSAVIVPKEDQTLQEGVDMLLEEIDLVKKGEFPDWLIPAIVNDFKFQRLKGLETADGLASNLYDVYIKGRTWQTELEELDDYATITKEEIIAFANDFFKDNYVVVFKEKGENENLIHVENPGITPIQLNREAQSEFLKEILADTPERIQPVWVDYKKEIKETFVQGRKLSFVRNKYNDIAQAYLIFPLGTDHDKELVLAIQLLQFLGTSKYQPQELREEFYKLGVNYDFKTTQEQMLISLVGLEENILKGTELLFHWIKEAVPNQEVYLNYVNTILESRAAAKEDKSRVMTGLINYAKFGTQSRFRNVVPQNELESMNVDILVQKMKTLMDIPYELFYYGNQISDFENFVGTLMDPISKEIATKQIFPEPETNGKVFFANYNMVQMEMSKVAKGHDISLTDLGKVSVFNEYFGRGLSSIVFQEMRESKSLAYSAYVSYQSSAKINHSDYIVSYIGTQPDKLMIAVDTLDQLMSELPQVPSQFENAKNAALKQIETNRINRTNIFFNTLTLKKLGLDYDYRQTIYQEIQKLTLEDLTQFYDKRIQSRSFNTSIIGKKENLNLKAVEKLGDFQEFNLEEIFGY